MKKCVRVTCSSAIPDNFLQDIVKPLARKSSIEGSARLIVSEKKIEFLICGSKNIVDTFVDLLHRELARVQVYDIEVEPFVKQKDYRGIFRVIE